MGMARLVSAAALCFLLLALLVEGFRIAPDEPPGRLRRQTAAAARPLRRAASCTVASAGDGNLTWRLLASGGVGEHLEYQLSFQRRFRRRHPVMSWSVWHPGIDGFEYAGSIEDICADEGRSYRYATSLSYDVLRIVVMAHVTDTDTCSCELDQHPLEWGFSCGRHRTAMVRFRSILENEERRRIVRFPPSGVEKDDCTAPSEWHCDMPTTRRLLLERWAELMQVRPLEEQRRLVHYVRNILHKSSPEELRRRMAALEAAGAGTQRKEDIALLLVVPTEYLPNAPIMNVSELAHNRARSVVAPSA
mmetsp:Transcript_35295/g.70146  ORF Transcript_35295/g.70146 Transcript_35295/m.70146 type:complete len:305 (+) Transcript_35295:60-974(+)